LAEREHANTIGPAHTAVRAWIVQKNKGVGLGMTWGIKFQRVAFALMVIGLLAVASGANWVDFLFDW